MPDLSFIVLFVLAWVLLSVLIACVLLVIPSWRRSGLDGRSRTGRSDRRTASRDRRVGLPDFRSVRTERRSGRPDRRRGPAATA